MTSSGLPFVVVNSLSLDVCSLGGGSEAPSVVVPNCAKVRPEKRNRTTAREADQHPVGLGRCMHIRQVNGKQICFILRMRD